MSEGIVISVKQDVRALYRHLDHMQRQSIRPAIRSTIRDLVRSIRTCSVRSIASDLGIKQKHIRKRVRNYGPTRELVGKVWIGLKREIGVNYVAGMTPQKAQQFAKYPFPVFQTKTKGGRSIIIQRKTSASRPTTEPKINLDQPGKSALSSCGNSIVNRDYSRILHRELKFRLDKRGMSFPTIEIGNDSF